MDDPSPQVAVVLAKLDQLDAELQLHGAQAALDAAQAAEALARSHRDALRDDRDQKRELLAGAVTAAYVRGDRSPSDDEITADPTKVLIDHALGRDRSQLDDAEGQLQSAEAALAAAVKTSNDALTSRDAAQTAADEATLAVAKASRLTNRTDVSPSVVGDAVLTADEIAGWYTTQSVVGYAGLVDLPTMVGYYIDEGKAEHVRGDVAFAQSMVETGAFTAPLTTHNNFAGIGACDTCETGFDFPTPKEGVRAQMQLLHAYADKTLRTSTLANQPVVGRPEDLSVRGCCDTWNKLTGTWATDTNYGPKLMTVYLSMLQYTLTQRLAAAAAAPPPAPAGPVTPAIALPG